MWKALDTHTNEIVALKTISMDAESDPTEVYRVRALLALLALLGVFWYRLFLFTQASHSRCITVAASNTGMMYMYSGN